jgi:hypothetical protein
MNEIVLKELAKKWKADAEPPQCEDGSDDAKLGNALGKGVRIGLNSCADDLLAIIKLLGSKS